MAKSAEQLLICWQNFIQRAAYERFRCKHLQEKVLLKVARCSMALEISEKSAGVATVEERHTLLGQARIQSEKNEGGEAYRTLSTESVAQLTAFTCAMTLCTACCTASSAAVTTVPLALSVPELDDAAASAAADAVSDWGKASEPAAELEDSDASPTSAETSGDMK